MRIEAEGEQYNFRAIRLFSLAFGNRVFELQPKTEEIYRAVQSCLPVKEKS